jgi:Saxitoxin biosynthesis operon protein SxtJ
MRLKTKIPTDRSFGCTFAVVFGLLGAWLLWRSNRFAVPVLGLGGLFAVAAVTIPRILHPLNVAWMHLGLLLNRVVSPIVLGAIFLLVFVPVGLWFRISGRDALHRSFDRDLRSYWIDRVPPGPTRSNFPRQF